MELNMLRQLVEGKILRTRKSKTRRGRPSTYDKLVRLKEVDVGQFWTVGRGLLERKTVERERKRKASERERQQNARIAERVSRTPYAFARWLVTQFPEYPIFVWGGENVSRTLRVYPMSAIGKATDYADRLMHGYCYLAVTLDTWGVDGKILSTIRGKRLVFSIRSQDLNGSIVGASDVNMLDYLRRLYDRRKYKRRQAYLRQFRQGKVYVPKRQNKTIFFVPREEEVGQFVDTRQSYLYLSGATRAASMVIRARLEGEAKKSRKIVTHPAKPSRMWWSSDSVDSPIQLCGEYHYEEEGPQPGPPLYMGGLTSKPRWG